MANMLKEVMSTKIPTKLRQGHKAQEGPSSIPTQPKAFHEEEGKGEKKRRGRRHYNVTF